MHGIAYDATHDEIVVPVALAAAVLVFRGGVTGDEAPIRVIQGPHTQLDKPHTVTVDEKNNEIIVGDRSGRNVLIYRRDANGDVAPLRVVGGAKTGLLDIDGVAVDPTRNLLFAASTSQIGGQTGVFIFNRTDNGDIAPRALISGPQTGILRPWQLAVDPEHGRLYVAAINNQYRAPYRLEKRRGDYQAPQAVPPSPWASSVMGFIGVWRETDNGDVPPELIIKGPASYLIHPAGVGINPQAGEVYATDANRNGLLMYLLRELF